MAAQITSTGGERGRVPLTLFRHGSETKDVVGSDGGVIIERDGQHRQSSPLFWGDVGIDPRVAKATITKSWTSYTVDVVLRDENGVESTLVHARSPRIRGKDRAENMIYSAITSADLAPQEKSDTYTVVPRSPDKYTIVRGAQQPDGLSVMRRVGSVQEQRDYRPVDWQEWVDYDDSGQPSRVVLEDLNGHEHGKAPVEGVASTTNKVTAAETLIANFVYDRDTRRIVSH